jgi:hypothetical protein
MPDNAWDELRAGIRTMAVHGPADDRRVMRWVDEFRELAETRARDALWSCWNPATRVRYHQDPEFHAMTEVLVATIVAGVFGEMPLTDDERALREKMIAAQFEPLAAKLRPV